MRLRLEAWRVDYNTSRPHSPLGWLTPQAYAATRRSAALRSIDGYAPPRAPRFSLCQSARPSTELQAMNPSFWRHKRVLVTGHTGFKEAGCACCLIHSALG